MSNEPIGRVGGVARSSKLRLCAALAGLALAAVVPCTAVLGGAPERSLEVLVEKAAAMALVPGGAADVTELRLRYEGKLPGRVGVYVARLDERAPSSSALCHAAEPAAAFKLLISSGDGGLVYAGSLADFAAAYREPARALAVPASGGSAAWDPGGASHVRIAVSLDPAADDAYMGCATSLQLGWVTSGASDGAGPDAGSGRGLLPPGMPRSWRKSARTSGPGRRGRA